MRRPPAPFGTRSANADMPGDVARGRWAERAPGRLSHSRRSLACILLIAIVLAGCRDRGRPRALRDEYPRVYFFRQSEGWAANAKITYEEWEKTFERLMGIEGKVLDEEVPGRQRRNIRFFTTFKRRHPDQLVLLHFNGNARDPRWQADDFFAGHWLYYNGAKVLSDIPATSGETEIRVSDPRLFQLKTGRYRDRNEDIGICALGPDGRPDWSRSEQVQLVAVDIRKGTITVRRGCYGTKPRAFRAGQAYAAAHVHEGPWGRRSNLMWFYNYSTRSPRDGRGRRCADVLVEDIARRFEKGGQLEAFDGIEFDVLHYRVSGRGRRGPDCDADGRRDDGIFDGVNTYGIGVVEFCRALRRRLGDRKLILADGMSLNNQRAFTILNGIESEGWPHLSDTAVNDWSGGLNRHFFWLRNAHRPVFNYVNHKFIRPSGKPGVVVRPKVGFNIHRLVFAAAVFTDSAICYSFAPPKAPGELIGIWDELVEGAERRLAWLGRPLGPPVRLAARQPDLLGGIGSPPGEKLLARISAPGTRVTLEGHTIRLEGKGRAPLRAVIKGLPCRGPDLFVVLTARAAPMRGYPREVARLAWLGLAPAGRPPTRFMTWLNGRAFTATFYFPNVAAKSVDLYLEIESGEPVWLVALTAHAYPDVTYREFERGLVVANPSPRPHTFDLGSLLPGRRYRRLRGTRHQDPRTNDGRPVGGKVVLGAKDALFLVLDSARSLP